MAELLDVMADGGCEIVNGNKLRCVIKIAIATNKYLAVTQDLTDPAKPRDIKAEPKKQLITAHRQLAALPMPVGRCRLKDRRPSFIPGALGRVVVVVKRMRKGVKGKNGGRKKKKIKGCSKVKRKRRSSKSYPFALVVHHLVKRMGSLSKKVWYAQFMNKRLSKILLSVTFDICALLTRRRVVFAPRKPNVKK